MVTLGTSNYTQVAEAFDGWSPLPQSHSVAGEGLGWRKQLFIIMTCPAAEASAVIAPPLKI